MFWPGARTPPMNRLAPEAIGQKTGRKHADGDATLISYQKNKILFPCLLNGFYRPLRSKGNDGVTNYSLSVVR
jgi:hypothetical protein